MSQNETIHVSATGGHKAGNLERYDLIPTEELRKLAEHYGRGAEKYDDDNWRRGYDWRLSYAALQRHANQFWSGEDTDAETGSPHLVAVAWHAFTLLWFMENRPGFDTRPTTLAAVECACDLPDHDVPDADRFFIDFLDSPVKPRVWDSIHDVPADTTVVDLEGALFRWASTGSSLLWWGDDWDEDPEGWDSWGPVTVSFSEAFGPFTEVIA